ncbi:MAG: multifunctional CCA addition/repair protein, partial [Gammaproteobacteria bacterium]|nr:multifunctional CCA addition/repair protein [Gammaproteobacteria bacterium]
RPVGEKDWVVVGGSAAELEAEGYKRVGKSFPVFLHPGTGEEYALARTETKTGPGHHGFDVYAESDVSLEDDLLRRDLTINAIAEGGDGILTDPYGGQADIEARLLRHVSDAFREDPLRVLRVARFAARFHKLGFRVATDTLDLMKDMAADGELDTLVPERIWKETAIALGESRPDIYIETLRNCGALEIVFPEINCLFGVPQPPKWHPEIDTGIHVLLVMRLAAQLSDSVPVRFAAMVHDLGKGMTDKRWWPSHRGHEQCSTDLINELCNRLGVPNRCRDLAINVGLYHGHSHRALQLRPDTVLKLIEHTDAFRRPERFEEFLLACEADARGRTGLEDRPYHQADILRTAFAAALNVSSEQLQEQGLEGPKFGAALRKARLEAVGSALTEVRGS